MGGLNAALLTAASLLARLHVAIARSWVWVVAVGAIHFLRRHVVCLFRCFVGTCA